MLMIHLLLGSCILKLHIHVYLLDSTLQMFGYDDKMNFADIPLLRRDRNCTRDPLQDQPKANDHNRESHLQDFAKLQEYYERNITTTKRIQLRIESSYTIEVNSRM